MSDKKLTKEQKNIDIDLWIISIATVVVFGIFIVFQNGIYGVIKNEQISVLFRVFVGGIFQYGLAGLGITIVYIFRKEHVSSYGLKDEWNALVCRPLRSVFCSKYYIWVCNGAD